ncbi:MAG: SusC/RagA family TonB-linked outer membrane protein, partial [Bacteroidales bacterium]|nr:SusC/RagA family TonB-linked outer membrane protein [Bacteroidales bacterium]
MKHLCYRIAMILLMATGLGCTSAFAQLVRGTVTDESGEPVIGAGIMVQGTTIGTTTDFDGTYTLDRVPANAVLEVSSIGYETQTAAVAGRSVINFVLREDAMLLDDVVVIGYGTQKKSVVTASIAKVSDELLEKTSSVRVDDALKGLAAGVTVTASSGQPGASSQVRIRGIGTINDSNPLYIVDGMPIGGGIDYINPSDILSIEVLKDAASGAVYGARAANGVILVTTKQGQKGSARVQYDFTYGWQNPWKLYDMMNATEYAVMMNRGALSDGKALPYADPYSLGEGTDWQKEIFNFNAPEQTHQLSVSGGNDFVNYYLSVGYNEQEGIVGGNWDRSNYKRLTIRTNTNYNLLDKASERTYLNKITAGVNLAYSRTKSTGITTNSEFGGPLGSALGMAPTLNPWYSEAETAAVLADHPTARVDPRNGRAFTIVDGVIYNEMNNPLAELSMPGNVGNSDKFVTNFWAEAQIWDNIKFKTSFGGDLSFWGNDWWTPAYYYSSKSGRDYSDAGSSFNRSFVWLLENTLSYDKQIGDHSFTVLLGQSAQSNMGSSLSGSNKYLVEEDPYRAGIGFTTGTQSNGDMSASGGVYSPHRISSLFARFSYNYEERYMFQDTVRSDGSSNFGPSHRF